MLTFFFISVLAIVLFGAGFYFWRSGSSQRTDELLLPPQPGFSGLFQNLIPASRKNANRCQAVDPNALKEQRQALLARATQGDKAALREAQASGDPQLYDEALNIMVDAADSEPALLALASHVMGDNGLRMNAKLARRIQESWKSNPTRGGTSKMLHIAARADDAKLLDEGIEVALEFWRQGRIPEMSAMELLSLFNGEFWTLSSEERSSGAGFVLKRTLARCQRELQPATDQ